MKGKIDLRFSMPNSSKVRTRLEVTEDFTPNLRKVLAEAVAEVAEEQQVAIKAKVIAKLIEGGLKVKPEHKEAVESVMKDFFTTYFVIGAEAAAARFSEAEAEAEAE